VPAWIGRGGVEEILELPLAEAELAELHAAAAAVRHFADELHTLEGGGSTDG